MQGRTSPPSRRLKAWGPVALVFGLVLACYWPALRGGLLWDDQAHVTRPDLRSWAGVGRIWIEVRATQQYYPVVHTAFWVEHRLWGDATLGYHLLNVLLHATSCCLLALVLRRLWDWRPTAAGPPVGSGGIPAGAEWLAAAIFAVHPVCVESVAWISEQKNTLSLVFYLSAAFAYLGYDANRRRRSYALALGCFLLALGTKSVTATLPAALLVALWWRNGRLGWRRDAVPLLPWFALAVISGLFTAWVERTVVGAEGARFDLTFVQRLLLAGRAVWFYLGKLAWPADLMFIYPRWNIAVTPAWGVFAGAAIAVTVALWLLRRRARGPLAGWLFFVGSLFPALGFFNIYPFLFSYVADHFQYLASLGVIVTAAAGIALGLAEAPAAVRAGGRVAGAALVLGLAFLAHRQSGTYRDSETLCRATLALDPASFWARTNLARELVRTPGREAEAITQYEQALRLEPQYAELHFNLGIQLSQVSGRRDDAIAQYREALRLKPDYASAHLNLAIELAKDPGRWPEALAHYEAALRLRPDFAEAHNDLAVALARIPGRLPEALAHYGAALRLRPDYGEAHANLADALAGLPGRAAEARSHYEAALQTNPGDASLHYRLSRLLASRPGGLPEALAHDEAALRLRPDYAEAQLNLADELAALPGRQTEALAHYEAALRLRPDVAEAHVNYANELATLPGRLPEALAQYETALRLRPDFAEAHYNFAVQLSNLPGQEQAAIAHYREAVRLKPGFLEAHNNLAAAYLRLGRIEEARRQWEQALRVDPNYEDARRNLKALLPGPSP